MVGSLVIAGLVTFGDQWLLGEPLAGHVKLEEVHGVRLEFREAVLLDRQAVRGDAGEGLGRVRVEFLRGCVAEEDAQ